ncbi:hypothetical protein CDL15_Pgr018063 [Punica granatum]|uniref:Uncharacterized protein n=1 Tax=Punica granatum TaxID=22663 RepID=A0A218WIH7_PUNGR|nr:hypothetical protein CDL15_Pgr018063 [Punica granatum]
MSKLNSVISRGGLHNESCKSNRSIDIELLLVFCGSYDLDVANRFMFRFAGLSSDNLVLMGENNDDDSDFEISGNGSSSVELLMLNC